jgi:hypothetical protein
MKAAIIITIVIVFLVGGLLRLRSSARTGMPSEDVLKRATERAKQLEKSEKKDED